LLKLLGIKHGTNSNQGEEILSRSPGLGVDKAN
jgi:hypothetical protein